MFKVIIFIMVFPCFIYAQRAIWEGPHSIGMQYNIPANKLTRIVLYNSDSTKTYTLFDNILERSQKLIILHQPSYYLHKYEYKDDMVIPYPILEYGLYYINYCNSDTCYTQKFYLIR